MRSISPKKPLYLVIIGPSGSGKSTQAKLLARHFGLVHISTGKLLRQEIKKKTKLGAKLASFVNKGRWVPSQLMFKVAQKALKKALKRGFVLEGFPRWLKQAKLLDRFLREHNLALTQVFYFQIPQEVILARWKKYREQEGQFYRDEKRSDEAYEVFKNKLAWSYRTLGPIVAYYQKRGILTVIDARRKIPIIFAELKRVVEGLQDNKE